jgi:predicted nucleic acid-binding protein
MHNARRVKVEHVLAHLKRFRILKDKIRNYKLGFNDLVMLLGAQLYNFKRAHSSDFYFFS